MVCRPNHRFGAEPQTQIGRKFAYKNRSSDLTVNPTLDKRIFLDYDIIITYAIGMIEMKSADCGENKRNYGIDALKILSMFMVVILHILDHSSVLEIYENTAQYHVAWVMKTAVYCAVNVFSMVTGYLMLDRHFKLSRLLGMWAQVVFYGLAINGIFAFFMPGSVGVKLWVKSLFPVTFVLWWYFAVYFILYLFIPFINTALRSLSKKQSIFIISVIFVFFSALPTLRGFDSVCVNKGFSVVWIGAMYVFGALIKRFDFGKNIKKRYCVGVYAVSVLLTWSSRLFILHFLKEKISMDHFICYTSPLLVFMAVSLLILFSRMNIAKCLCRPLKFLSTLSFAVYIIHEHTLVKTLFLPDLFDFSHTGSGLMALEIPSWAVLIFAAGISAEYLRLRLFKITGLSGLICKIGGKFENE